MTTVLAITIPLATLIGFAEEFTFRGYLPLILAAKSGLPLAAVVGVSGVIFGVSWSFIWREFFLNVNFSVFPSAAIDEIASMEFDGVGLKVL